MARRAVRLLLAIILLAAVLFHPDAVVEGDETPARPDGVVPYHRCECEVTRLDLSNSPVSKVPAISEIIGITEHVCKQVEHDVKKIVADDVKLVFQDEEGRCDAKCKTGIKSGLLEAMKHYSGLVKFIIDNRPSIERLKEFICDEDMAHAEPFSAKPPKDDVMKNSAEGEDNNESKLETTIKDIGRKVKEAPLWIFQKLRIKKKENPVNHEKACEKLKRFPKVKFYMTF